MVPVTSLWMPIVVSAVIVFFVSSFLHMVLPYHHNDLRKTPNEDAVLDVLRRMNLPPGDYGVPHAGSMAGMKDPVFIDKMTKGPIALMTVAPGAAPSMGRSLGQWFAYLLVVGFFAA